MHGSDQPSVGRVRIKVAAAFDTTAEIGFEPVGTTFTVSNSDFVTLELPADAAAHLELVAWPNGVAVWLPYPGDYIIFDSSGKEIARL